MIELTNISGGYGNYEVIRELSLKFSDGQITALVGPNGSGKSTLLNLCRGEIRSIQGEIMVDGRPISALSRISVARKIALLPQSRAVPDITVGALVLHGRFPWLGYPRVYRAEDKAAVEKAMERAGIWEKRHKLLVQLSGGERQKAYIAMLLAQGAGNILMDEPMTYLDIAHQLELMGIMKELKNEGKCVIAVLHDLSAAMETSDQVAVIKNGGLLAVGTPEDVMASGAIEGAFGVRPEYMTRIGFERIFNRNEDQIVNSGLCSSVCSKK